MTFALTPADPHVDGPRFPIHAAPDPGPPEVRYREVLSGHLIDAGVVAQEVALPAPWIAVRDRWTRFADTARPCRERLLNAVATGAQDEDLAVLRAAALAEIAADAGHVAELLGDVGAAIHAELTRLYAPHAAKVYKQIALLFNEAAKRADDERLDELTPALLASARLAGADQDISANGVSRLGATLTIDPVEVRRRRKVAQAWPAWQRCRELDANIHAHPDPCAELWRLPRFVACVDEHRRVTRHDPCDGELPRGWALVADGWLAEQPDWSAVW